MLLQINFPKGFLYAFFAVWLAACGGGGGGSDDGGEEDTTVDPIVLGLVLALFENNGANWNDYVAGLDIGSATDSVCAIVPQCIHAGELRAVEVTGRSSCTGLTATDALGAFDWVCDAGTNPVRMISTGLADGKYLSDLIDFTTPAFRDNSVTVRLNGAVFGNTPASAWWSNPLTIDNAGGFPGDAGTIYLVTANPSASYQFGADRQAMVIQPGVTITGPGTGVPVVSHFVASYFWIEGSIDATSDFGLDLDTMNFVVARNLEVTNSSGAGLVMQDVNAARLDDIATSSNGANGMLLTGVGDSRFTNLVANDNGSGLSLVQGRFNTFSNLTTNDNTNTDGIRLDNSPDNSFTDVRSEGNNLHGVSLNLSFNNQFTRLIADGNAGDGVNLTDSPNSRITDVSASHNDTTGLIVSSSSLSRILNVSANNNGNHGVSITGNSNGSRLQNIVVIGNGGWGLDLGGSNQTLVGLTATSNAAVAPSPQEAGLYLTASDSRIAMVTTSNNREDGVIGLTGGNNTYLGLSSGNNLRYGLDLAADNNTLQAVAVTNANFGIRLNGNSGNVFANTASGNNALEGITLTSIFDVRFTGLLEIGNNGFMDCTVLVRTGFPTPGVAAPNCAANGASDHFLLVPIDLSGAFVGRVMTDDSSNDSDVNGGFSGFPVDPDAFDWGNFDNVFRGWGNDAGSFRGIWADPNDGRIWDWSVASADNGAAPAGCATPPCPALLGAVETFSGGIPDGDHSLVHVWGGTPGTSDNAGCDVMITGSVWNGAACETEFLRDAMEVMSDGIGNENSLCESGETCVYMPNIGAYQGHGNLVSAGAFVDGSLTGITLLRYASNGR